MTTTRRILIVEDDQIQREILGESLGGEFNVSTAATLAEADAILGTIDDARFDAIVLDVGLPDGNGHDHCHKLRRQGHKMPIIIVTGSGDEAEVVRGLDAGANDCMTKPFRLNELQARLRAHLRIFDNSEDATFTIGRYTFRPAAKTLMDHAANRRLRLTGKEAAILKFLYRAGARSVARPTLLEEVWGYKSGVTTHTLETHIYRLRQKLEVNPGNCRLLVTDAGGYRLNAALAA